MKNLLRLLRSSYHPHALQVTDSESALPVTLSVDKTKPSPIILGFACFFGLLAVSTQATALNRIQTENALPGNSEWYWFNFPANPHDMEGYADKDSVNIGSAIKFFVNANPSLDSSYSLSVYRLGWYNGVGGRRVLNPVSRASVKQVIPAADPATGMVQANWNTPYTLNVPSTWTSGIYIATIVGNTTGKGQYIPFVVRDVNRTSNYLFQASTSTWQAYNNWGGKSLYGYNSDTVPVKSDKNPIPGSPVPARKVSFNRPYAADTAGLGSLMNWEINMLYFLESKGYDVTYQSSTDTHTGNGGLLNHKTFLSVGHDEYWSKAMRDNVESAQNRGIGLGFFGANAAYWQIRMENSVAPLATQQNRTIVGYKDYAVTEDPLALDLTTSNNNLVTNRWREGGLSPFLGANRPENSLIGIMYSFYPADSNIIQSKNDPSLGTPSNWIYTGTDTTIGKSYTGLLGYEADRVFDNGKTPATLEIIAASPLPVSSLDDYPPSPASANHDPANPKSHMTVYTKPCTVTPCINPTSTVFATGSMQWIWGLDSGFKNVNFENVAADQVTTNALARLANTLLPAPAMAASSSISADPALSTLSTDTVTSSSAPSLSANRLSTRIPRGSRRMDQAVNLRLLVAKEDQQRRNNRESEQKTDKGTWKGENDQ